MDQSQYDAGMKVRREVLGDEYVDRAVAATDELTKPLQDLVNEYGWGACWTRPGLDRRTRSFMNIAMLTALNRPHELAVHLKGAMNNGLSREEIVEAVLQTAIYCGLPAALDSMRHVKKAFEDADAAG
ncbi:carboxymuconolactone decarboxylase family protein [Thalassospiraceae bacterium LMO-JJ14]|nr:carboxymuconolactone decarboxylase family protein [Thalassospiraceae bacterium LMO-JJ14]